MRDSLVFMGVAGCGKSSLGALFAAAHGVPLVEGDAFHSTESRHKMSQGIALTDADRAGWLDVLGDALRTGPGAVLTCSALRRVYRDRLRQAAPGLRFAYLEIDRAQALARVQARAAHFFSSSLVDSQFATLEPPVGEPGVLCLDATAPMAQLMEQIDQWLAQPPTP